MAKEQKTKSFVLRIDATTMEALEKWAADEFRSINGQLQWLIDKSCMLNTHSSNVPLSVSHKYRIFFLYVLPEHEERCRAFYKFEEPQNSQFGY